MKPLLSAIVFFGIFGTLSVGYSALTAGLTTGDRTSSGSVLSSDSWNRMVNSILELDARTSSFSSSGGNVGIGITNPAYPFDIRTTYNRAAHLWSSNADYFMGTTMSNSNLSAAAWGQWAIGINGSSPTTLSSYPSGSFLIHQDGVWPRMNITSSGNVGIGVPSPTAKLEVNGTVKAAKLDSASGEFVSIALGQCGGGCTWNHTLNAWTNAGAQNYNWVTHMNTATDNFTHNGKWTITVAKAWTYRIRLQAMFIPTANTAYGEIVCPAINGTANCGYNSTFAYNHRYAVANWWSQPQHEFVFQLAAGNTVAWAYQPIVAMTYWAHDNYTALEITRIQ